MGNTADARTNSRQKIIDTALRLFGQQGYEKTSVREIARVANISLGLMYNYFSSKEALLQAIIQDGLQEIQHSFAGITPNRDRLGRLVEQYFASLEKMKDHWRLLHSIRMQQHLHQLLSCETEAINNYIIGELSLILQDMRYDNPVHEAVLLFASLDGMASHYLTNRQYPLKKIARLLVSKYHHL